MPTTTAPLNLEEFGALVDRLDDTISAALDDLCLDDATCTVEALRSRLDDVLTELRLKAEADA